ncbi:MAG: type II toxin-antitoxin system RelE/ParE family toxin [Candidatus Thermoplasmatota archaeon]|nr:type II toxin-antitoxin system RelE/ParE family toxin [Candidatus Thermoplasmatota archaeon]
MPDYAVKWTETSARLLEKMESVDAERILEKMKLVSKNPFHYVKRLKGVPLYSLRTGKYRVIMSIERENLVILVVDVGNRKNVYDEL